MNIAIDITPLSDEHHGRGTGVYTKLLIEALKKHEVNNSYSYFTRGQKIPNNTDLVHYPYFEPFFLTLPIFKSKPTVVTVHDVIPLVFPNEFPAGIRGQAKWRLQKASLGGVRHVITDSNCSKKDINKIIGIPETKISVVYLAPSPIYQRVTNKERLQKVKEKYGLPEKFIVYVGDVNWNKNIPGLLRAFSIINNMEKNNNVSLMLIGKSFINHSLTEVRRIHALIEELHLKQSIMTPGYIMDEDLAAIYSTATCLVQTSFYEGFGFPVLEAMMCGCPVVVASNSSLTEIAGPAIKVDLQKEESINFGISSILRLSENGRMKMIEQGVEWAKSFTWQKVAHETVGVYEKVAAST